MQINNPQESSSGGFVNSALNKRSNHAATETTQINAASENTAHLCCVALTEQPSTSASTLALSNAYFAVPSQRSARVSPMALRTMESILPSLIEFSQTPYRVADMPNPDFDPQADSPVSRYRYRDSVKFADKPSQVALSEMTRQGIPAKNALHHPAYWGAMVISIENTGMHSIKCLNAAALVGEKLKTCAQASNLHVYQAGIKEADHHIVLVTSTPVEFSPGQSISASGLPADAIVVDAWTHYIDQDRHVEVAEQRGTLGQERVYFHQDAPRFLDVKSFMKSGMLSTVTNNPQIVIEPDESDYETTQLTLFCEITEHVVESSDDASEYTEVTVGFEDEIPENSGVLNDHNVISGMENLLRNLDGAD